MVRREVDWKRQGSKGPDRVMAVVIAVLAVVYFYQWWLGNTAAAYLAVGFGAWEVLYYSNYWQPVLYLVAAGVILGVTALFLGRGNVEAPINQIAIVFNVLFFFLCLYLFWSEESVTKEA